MVALEFISRLVLTTGWKPGYAAQCHPAPERSLVIYMWERLSSREK